MLTKSISFINFKKSKKQNKAKKIFLSLIKEKNYILNSLSKNYKSSFKIDKINHYKKSKNFRVIGMGGSVLGTQTIYDFLKHKKKKFFIFW